jgi:RNA polymerase sigma factor (sigma-70 family)
MRQLMRRLRESAKGGSDRRAGDGELLDAFRRRGDREALGELVERHGPMVLGVCRRALPDPHDAEDAFQATFLVLLRNAAAVRPASRLGPWIHGVARRTALAARVCAARRRRLETTAAGRISERSDAPDTDIERDEIRQIIDREVERLPGAYRAAVVQCDLLGRPRKEAAAELGWPEGTLSVRLARARRLLGDRLARAGLAPAAAAVALVEAEPARAVVPPALARAARQWIDEPQRAPDVARLLADQVGRSMGMSITRHVAAFSLVLFASAAVAVGAIVFGEEQKESPPTTQKPAASKPDPDWHLILEKSDRRVAVRLADSVERELTVGADATPPSGDPLAERKTVAQAPSPDGKRVAYQMTRPRLGRLNGTIVIADADGRNMRNLTDDQQSYYPAWSPDGKRIVFLSDRSGEWHIYSISADAAKDNAERVSREPAPDNCRPCFAADGRLIYTIARGRQGKIPLMDLVTWDGREEKKLVEKNYVLTFAVSPDGSKLAYVLPNELVVHDLKTDVNRRWAIKDVDPNWQVTFFQVLWRPDSGALGLSLGFLGGLQQGARVAGDDYVAVLTLDRDQPQLRTYRVGTDCRLLGWATDADLNRRK